MNPPRRDPGPVTAARRGFLLVEVTAGVLLLLAVLTMTVQLLAWSGAARRAARHRQWARHEAQNVLDLVAALPPAALTTEALAARGLGARAERALPGGKLTVTADDLGAGDLPSRRVVVAVSWRGRSGEPTAPIRLVAWVPVPDEEAAP